MSCPGCKGILKKTSLADYLSGQTCTGCNGVTFTLSDYLHYLAKSESIKEDLSSGVGEFVIEKDTKKAMVCNCGQIMNKYRISEDSDRRIDCCHACQTIWLDGGEWDYLKAKDLHKRVNNIFTGPYQRNIRLAGTVNVLDENYQKQLGVKDYEHLKEVRAWLINNPNKAVMLSYLNSEDPYSVEK